MKKKIAVALIFLLILGGVGIGGYWYFFGDRKNGEEIAVGENQTLIVAQISTINGNEITYSVAEEKPNDTENQKMSKAGEKSSGMEGQRMPEGMEKPSDMGGQGMSEGMEKPNGMEGQGIPEGKMPSENTEGEGRKRDSEEDNSAQSKIMYMLTGEEVTTFIPVGTKVTTQLGTTTTFSRLAAGDMVKLLMEKDAEGKNVIVGIWMVG